MEFVKKLEFGNYTLKFGDDLVLMDLIDDIVMPSFHEMNYRRSIREKSEFFFLDTEMIVLDNNPQEPVIGIKGKLVKNTVLTRDQIFSDNKLVEDYEELETAPSSFFLLILNSHRLILSKEVSGAPTIENFQSTSQYCLTQRWIEFINETYDSEKKIREDNPQLPRITKKSLRIETPSPKLRITTLTDKKSLEEFIELFEKINRLSIKLLPTNQEEIDNDDFFWQEFGQRNEALNSNQASVLFTNPQEGLSHNAVLNELNSATSLANSEFNMKGYDEQGDIMKGSNDNFNLSCEVPDLARDTNIAAQESYKEFTDMVADGRITLPRIQERRTLEKIIHVFNRFRK
ncbi:TPA: hypothetical protein ACWGK2_000877 [Yersinia enterocolitica]